MKKDTTIQARLTEDQYQAFKKACGMIPMSAVIRSLINDWTEKNSGAPQRDA